LKRVAITTKKGESSILTVTQIYMFSVKTKEKRKSENIPREKEEPKTTQNIDVVYALHGHLVKI